MTKSKNYGIIALIKNAGGIGSFISEMKKNREMLKSPEFKNFSETIQREMVSNLESMKTSGKITFSGKILLFIYRYNKILQIVGVTVQLTMLTLLVKWLISLFV